MVLLTSSSISVAISSGVVFLFTFLLFLSGYVVQQQTVRSLQVALHPPPIPTSTLPAYFQKTHASERTGTANLTNAMGTVDVQERREDLQETQELGFKTITKYNPVATSLAPSKDETEVQLPASNEHEHQHVTEALSAVPSTTQSAITDDNMDILEERPIVIAPSEPDLAHHPPTRLAYAQLLSNPSQICSALLFFKLQMDYGDTDISRVILYPSLWEDDTSSDAFSSALALMRLFKDDYNIVYQPIRVENSSEERDIERDLVVHLATNNGKYDRMMYLRSPGLALNIAALDSALEASKTNSLLSRNWAVASAEPSTAPSILLISDHGIHTPRGSNRRLTAEAFTSHADHLGNEMDVEVAAQRAAYVHFAEGELEHRRTEKEWYGGIFETYERGRAEICRGSSFDGERTELRRARKRGGNNRVSDLK